MITENQARLLAALTQGPMQRDTAEERYHRATIASTLDRHWIQPGGDHMVITDRGRKALNDHLDAPRLLTPASRPPRVDRKSEQSPGDSDRGYTDVTSRALREEPEAIDDWTQQRYSETAEIRDRERKVAETRQRKADRKRLDFEDRLVAAEHRARETGVVIRSEKRALERMKAAGQPQEAVVRQLETIERLVDREAA